MPDFLSPYPPHLDGDIDPGEIEIDEEVDLVDAGFDDALFAT